MRKFIGKMHLFQLCADNGMDKHLTDTFIKIVAAEHVVAGEPMNRHTTFKVGGPAELFVTPASVEQVQAVLAACVAHEKQIWILGRGSNLVVADRGIRGVVIHIGPEMANVSIDEDGTATLSVKSDGIEIKMIESELACCATLVSKE